MVTRGQFLERPTLIPVGGHVLEGLWHRGQRSPPLLIVPPAPQEGGGMDHVVAAEVAWAAATSGHPTLRFNFRGVGASQGKVGAEADRLVEVEAAVRVLRENTGEGGPAVLLLGGSGALAEPLGRRCPELSGVGLVSPSGVGPETLLRISAPVLVVVGAKDLRVPRAAFAAAAGEAGGTCELIEDADATFHRNLPQVGKAVARWLAVLGDRPQGPR